jgi:undecaprenyl-diphosphatase
MPTATRPTPPARLARLLLTLAGAAFTLLALAVALGTPLAGLDERVSAGLNEHARHSPGTVAFFLAVTHLGDTKTLLALGLVVALVLLLWVRRPMLAAVWALALLSVAGTNEGAKHLFQRHRPSYVGEFTHATGDSFPSGHAAGSASVYGLLAWLLVLAIKPRAGRVAVVAGAVLVAGLVAFSRVYLGVHYLSDVLAGAAGGVAWVCVAVLVLEALRREAPAELTPPPAGDPSAAP